MIGPFLPAGTKVRYDGLVKGGPEFGVVIHCWISEEFNGYDFLAAFFGNEFPSGEPTDKPYVLRYAAVSLTVVNQ